MGLPTVADHTVGEMASMFTPTVGGDTDADLHALADELGIKVWTLEPGHTSRRQRIMRAARESPGGRLPPRYATDTWDIPFRPRLQEALRPRVRILDVGAGARPMIEPAARPPGTHYVGFDIDGDELRQAP